MDEADRLLEKKYKKLQDYLNGLKKAVIAYSAGVDSTFLLKNAHDVLGDKVFAVTAYALTFPDREYEEAKEFCEKENIKQYIVSFDPFAVPGFSDNDKNRCYVCKKELLGRICDIASENGVTHVLEGSNADDVLDYRPGLLAVEELGIKSPLRYAGLTKEDIRNLSKKLNLQTWDKPSFACLASRFVYGETITKEKLMMVNKAEKLLFDMGFKQFRVRIHGKNLARIEVLPEEIKKLMDNSRRIISKFNGYGFTYVTVDMKGYRTGSMNEVL